MDTLNQEEVEAKIFFNIAENGPISIYAASDKKDTQNPPFTTVHRHFKRLESENLITIYKKEKHQNKKFKFLYGPTSEGIAEFYFSEKGKPIRDIEPVFNKWAHEEKFFQDENGQAIFDFNGYKYSPGQILKNFKKWVEFIKKADDYREIPEELELDVGMLILGKKEPKYFINTILELYGDIPAFRINLDKYFKNVLGVFEFIQKIQKEPRNPTYLTQKLFLNYWPMMTPKEMKKIQKSKEPRFNFEYMPTSYDKKPLFFENKTLTELANDTFDNLLDNYVMLVCKPDSSVINDEEIKFIMSHCADNFSETGNALAFEELSRPEWYNPELPLPKNDTISVMINPYSDHDGPFASQFYDNFEIFVPNLDEINAETLKIDEEIEKEIGVRRKLAEKIWAQRRESSMK